MIEQAMRSALLLTAGILLSAGALGQSVTLEQDNTQTVTVASEYFGAPGGQTLRLVPSGTEFGFDNQYVGVVVDITGPNSSATLAAGNEAEITYTLNGATFAGPVTANDLKYFIGGTEDGAISRSLKEGGAVGDRTVTFTLTVRTAITNVHTGSTERLWFRPPSLQVTPVVLNPRAALPQQIRGATITASIKPTESLDNPFPASIVGESGATDQNSNRIIAADPAGGGNDDSIVVRLAPALAMKTLGVSTANVATVDIENRKVIVSGTQVTTATTGGRPVQGLRVGQLTIELATAATSPRTLTASTRSVTAAGLDTSLGGTADLTVSGPFQAGDMVLLGADQTQASAKQFTVNENNNTATLSVPIGAFSAEPVIYVPGGIADLRPSRFNASLALDFNLPGADDGVVGSSQGQLNYSNIAVKAYAYGVSRANDAEITSFLRTTCASVTPPATVCSVFINCAGENGARYFGELTANAPLRNGSTGVYTSGDIASALGGGWSAGGGRCDLLSNGDLEVQHMIRTSGNALHNNSIVIGRTQSANVGVLRSRGPHPVGSVTLSLGPAATPGEVRLLSTGRIYGPIDVIRALAAQLRGSTGLQPGTRFYAPPGAMSGGRQPMVHEPGCAYLERDLRVTPVNCFHLDDANPDVILVDSIVLMSGDIIYPNRAVFRPSDSTLLQPAASATAPVLSG